MPRKPGTLALEAYDLALRLIDSGFCRDEALAEYARIAAEEGLPYCPLALEMLMALPEDGCEPAPDGESPLCELFAEVRADELEGTVPADGVFDLGGLPEPGADLDFAPGVPLAPVGVPGEPVGVE